MKKDQQNLLIAGAVGVGLLVYLKTKNDAAKTDAEKKAKVQRERLSF